MTETKAPEQPYVVAAPKKKGLSRQGKIAVLTATGILASGIAYSMIGSASIPPIITSDASTFEKDAQDGGAFGALAPDPKIKSDATDAFASLGDALATDREAQAQRTKALEDKIAQLQQQMLTRESSNVAAPAQAAPDGSTLAKLNATVENLKSQLSMQQAASDAKIAALEASVMSTQSGQDSQIEAQAQLDLETRRAKALADMDARVHSDSIVFDGGQGKSGGGAQASGTLEGPAYDPNMVASANGPKSADEAGRSFVQGEQQAVTVEKSGVIADPSHTILQGTVIQATLENAVDSSLPGQLTAVVNFPVYAFDQSRILIPAGSRIFGSYSSDVTVGQGRILIGWTRLVTPEGQSVQMQAFGGDAAGRSGMTGKVNSHFGTKFGTAALISIISALPAIAAARTTNETTQTLETSTGSGLQTATQAAIGQYIAIAPTITVQAGAAVTVMVDRDLAFN